MHEHLTDLVILALLKQQERVERFHSAPLPEQTSPAAKAECARFMAAYRLRSLVNRYAPALAPRLGL